MMEDIIMAEGMKSALELALERTDHVRKAIHEEGLTLTDAQREQLAELEREYSAKIAEKDVMLQAEMRKLLMQYPPAEVGPVLEQLRDRFIDEKRKLMEEKEEKAARIRHANKAEEGKS
jgi:pyrroline-5-carboxylate reductase